jgi:hypothetical protein
MSYSTDKLIAIFGCNLSDLINIEKEILKKPVVKTVNSPDFLMHFFENLPLDEFKQQLKINKFWYSWCKGELEYRWNKRKNQYWEAVAEHKRISRKYDKLLDRKDCSWSILEKHPIYKKYSEIQETNKKFCIFKQLVEVEKAIVRCGFSDLIIISEFNYHIKMLEDGFDPYEVDISDEDWDGIDWDQTYLRIESDNEDDKDSDSD